MTEPAERFRSHYQITGIREDTVQLWWVKGDWYAEHAGHRAIMQDMDGQTREAVKQHNALADGSNGVKVLLEAGATRGRIAGKSVLRGVRIDPGLPMESIRL